MTDHDPGVEPFPFATLSELRLRWPDMPEGIEDEAEAALEDASQFILDVVPSAVDVSPITRRNTVIAVVKQALRMPDELHGMESVQQSTGPFSYTTRLANPHGGFYLTTLQWKSLGGGRQRAFSPDLLAGSRRAHEDYDADQLP